MNVIDERGRDRASRFAIFAWLDLAYNVGVILWGAVVRATSSGAGCGDHWPLCQGVVIPHAAQLATVIEFAHRATSGIAVALVVALIFFTFRGFSKGHAVRRYAAAALFFTLTEGLLGAALVLFGDVGNNASMSRVFVLSLHLVNTFLLLASLALTAKSASDSAAASEFQDQATTGAAPRSSSTGLRAAYFGGLIGAIAIAVTGTIAALSDTLFPAASLAQGFQMDFSKASNPILRLRIIHPAVAVMVGCFLMVLAVHALTTPSPAKAKRGARCLLALIFLQFGLGALNVILLAPVWMQVLHLLTADLVWIALVLLSAEMLAARRAARAEHVLEPVPASQYVK
jgi:heme a synthase